MMRFNPSGTRLKIAIFTSMGAYLANFPVVVLKIYSSKNFKISTFSHSLDAILTIPTNFEKLGNFLKFILKSPYVLMNDISIWIISTFGLRIKGIYHNQQADNVMTSKYQTCSFLYSQKLDIFFNKLKNSKLVAYFLQLQQNIFF